MLYSIMHCRILLSDDGLKTLPLLHERRNKKAVWFAIHCDPLGVLLILLLILKGVEIKMRLIIIFVYLFAVVSRTCVFRTVFLYSDT